jgi:hypothetical protein
MRSAEERHAKFEEREAKRKETYARRMAAINAKTDQRTAAADAAKAARQEAAALEPVIRAVKKFEALGVQVMDNGDIHTFNGFAGNGRRLGPAAGAIVEIGVERRRHRVGGAAASTLVLGPIGLLGAAGKKAKASAFVTLADGTFHEHKLSGNGEVSRGHRQAAAFQAAIIAFGR